MALIKCAECGREISDKATACIHCGCPISVSLQNAKPAAAPVSAAAPSLSVNFNARLTGDADGTTQQKVYVKELGRAVEFPLKNDTKTGDTVRVALREGSPYSHILFTAVAVSGPQPASAAADIDPLEFLNQRLGFNDPNTPTVSVEAQLPAPGKGFTALSVFVPEFNRNVQVNIPNSITAGQTFKISADINAAVNGINKPLNVLVTKVTYPTVPTQKSYSGTATQKTGPAPNYGADMAQKIKALKRRVYTVPIIRLVCSLYFILSFAGMFLMMGLYPDGGTPDFLMNIIGIGFSLGFIPVFCFTFLPYIVGRYPDPNFFKTLKAMKHLEKRNLLEKAVTEMETCTTASFGDKMCLSDNFLFPKKKNGIIIPCDELLWVYATYSRRRSCGQLMLGTKKWGIQCYSIIRGRKKYEQAAPVAIQALQRRNPDVLVGQSRENLKQYDLLRKM